VTTLRLSQHCDHSGDITFDSTTRHPLCGDCGTPMVWVSVEYLDSLRRDPSVVEQGLRQQFTEENAHLLAIYHTLANVLMSRGRL
jgi:tartrate dehydratase alpha subunit/fumarate hydratase class I-like protein